MEGPAIAIVRSSRDWARALHRYVADYGGAVVRVRPLEERQAIDEVYDVLIIDDVSSFLSNRLIQELHRRGRRVIGVYDSNDIIGGIAVGKDRLDQMGCDATIDANNKPEEFLRLVQATAPVTWDSNEDIDQLMDEFRSASGMPSEVPQSLSEEMVRPAQSQPKQRAGQVTAVIGASGGVGVTEVVIELARVIRARGEIGIAIDANDVAPAIAQRLALPLHPNIRTAIDAVEHSVGRLAETILAAPGNQATVMCGLPHPKDWMSLRPEEVMAVIDELSRVCHHIIVDVAPQLDDLGGMGGIDRFGISRAVLADADAIVLVGVATPVGIARILDRAAELQTIVETTPVHIIINRTPTNSFIRNELTDEITRTYMPKSLNFIAPDKKVDEASWSGSLVGDGPFTETLRQVGLAVMGMNTAVRSRTSKSSRRSKRSS